MLAQVALAFLPVIITNEGCKAHIDKGSLISHMYRDMTTIGVFHDKGDYLMAGRRAEGASAFGAEGYNFPATSPCKLLGLGYRSVISH